MPHFVLRALIPLGALALSVGCAHRKAAEPAPVAQTAPTSSPQPSPEPQPASQPEPAPKPEPARPIEMRPVVMKSARPVAQRIHVEKHAITIDDRIFFETGLTRIDPQSFELLDGIAQVINDNRQIRKLRIEGYTDNTGRIEVNRQISQGRAEAVLQYLVGKGVAASRLEAKGFGPESPIASNDTEEGREQNRRVEFRIAK